MRLFPLLVLAALVLSAAPAVQSMSVDSDSSAASDSVARLSAQPPSDDDAKGVSAQQGEISTPAGNQGLVEWTKDNLLPVSLGLGALVALATAASAFLRRQSVESITLAPLAPRASAKSPHPSGAGLVRNNRLTPQAVPIQTEMVPKADLDAARETIASLQQELAATQSALAAPSRAQVLEPSEHGARTMPGAAQPNLSDAVTEAFATWCRTGGGLVDKHDLFANQIARFEAVLEVVRRDQDSPARPVYFDATGGNSPAAHWLVRVGSEKLLFPQPQGPHQFRDLAPVFEGQAVPQSIRAVVPARVTAEGSGYVLTQPGRVA